MTDEGWTTMRFDEFAERINETVMPAESDLDRYIGLEHLDTMDLTIRRWDEGRNLVGKKLVVRKGDIIIARRNWYLRRVAIAPFDALCSAHAMIVRPKKGAINPDFLPFFLLSDQFYQKAMAISVGSLSPTINWTTLSKVNFKIPALEEQISVTMILACVLETLDRHSKSLVSASILKRKLLFDITLGNLSSKGKKSTRLGSYPNNWNVATVGELGTVQMGRQRAPKYQTGNFSKPYLRVANVLDGYIDFSDLLEMDFNQSDYEKYRLNPGDILLNEGQSKELVGRCAVYDGSIDDCCFQNTLIRFVPGGKLDPDYAFFMLQSAFYRRKFESLASRTTSIAHLGSKNFSKMLMAYPPIDEQQNYVEILMSNEKSRNQLIANGKISHNLLKSSINLLLAEEVG